jgi:tetratricopeptide (TPR) repeat protein
MKTRSHYFAMVALLGLFLTAAGAKHAGFLATPPQTIRYNFEYKCDGETIVIGHCRKDSDQLGFPPTRPEDDYCQIYYPDRPKRGGFTAMGTELRSDMVRKLQACGALGGAPSQPRPAQPTSGAPQTSGQGAAQAYLNQGIKLYNAKNYPGAVEAFKKCATLRPDTRTLATTYAWLGSAYRELKQYDNAIAAEKESLRLFPNSSETTFGLGWCYYLAGQHQNALATLTEAARLDPNGAAETYYWIGEVYFSGLKQPEKALPAYRESLRLRPNDARTINQMGLAYSGLGELQESLAAFKEAVRLKPDVALYQSNLGLTYVQLGMKEEALATSRTLRRIDSVKAKEIEDQVDNIFPKDKDDPESLVSYAMITHDMGYPESALPIYRRAILRKAPPDALAVAYRGMGDSYRELKMFASAKAAYQQALPIYQQLLRANPRDPYLYYGLGMTYLGLGQKDQALQLQRRMLPLDKKRAQELLDEINKSK